MSYSSQVVHGALTPLVELVGALLFIAFLFALYSIVTKHRVFGWGLPGDVPVWVGVLVLIVLYRVIVSPLRQARYASYYGPHFGQGWLALFGVLLWLAIVTFCVGWPGSTGPKCRPSSSSSSAASATSSMTGPGRRTICRRRYCPCSQASRCASYPWAPVLENSSRMDRSTARTCFVMLPTEM